MVQYRTLIAQAFRFSTRHRFLWVLALLVALGGTGDELELIFSGTTSLNGQASTLGYLWAMYTNETLTVGLQNSVNYLRDNLVLSATVAMLLVLGFLLFVWVVIVAQGALVWATNRLQTKNDIRFGASFTVGMRMFSPVFLINLFTRAIVLLIMLVVAIPLGYMFVRTGNMTYDSLYILVAFLALIPLSVFLGFLTKFAAMYIVLQNQSWSVALRKGMQLFKKNWLVTVEVALVILAINTFGTLLFTVVMGMTGLPFTAVGFIVFLVLLLIVGAFLASFSWSAWVLLFQRLEQGSLQSKLVRWVDAWQQRGATQPDDKQKIAEVPGA